MRVIAAASLVALCGCSLLYDASDLGRGRSNLPDASNVSRDASFSDDAAAPVDEAAQPDPALDSGGDAGGGEATGGGEDDGAMESGGDAARFDGAPDDAAGGSGMDSAADSAADASGLDGAADSGSLAVGLVAFYPFDETSGPTSADTSGNGHTAIMQGATFAPGLRGNAATLSGAGQYVNLPDGIVANLRSFSICFWVKLNSTSKNTHLFNFGTGTLAHMFLTPISSLGAAQFVITVSGYNGDQNVDAPALTTASWQHLCVTSTAGTTILFVNGAQVGQNTAMTLNPARMGKTTQNWLGKSTYANDPYLNAQVDNFRIVDHALSASEVQGLFQQQL